MYDVLVIAIGAAAIFGAVALAIYFEIGGGGGVY